MTINTLEISRPVRRLTVALGLFDGPLAVQSALRDLGNHGFGIDRIKVFTSVDARGYDRLSDDLMPGSPPGSCAFHRIETDARCDANSCIHDLVRQALSAATTGHADETIAIWGLERQANSLMQHLADGGGVLIVRVESAEEQRAVCSMLLHYANRGVQTHQLRYGRPTAGQAAGVVGHSLTS